MACCASCWQRTASPAIPSRRRPCAAPPAGRRRAAVGAAVGGGRRTSSSPIPAGRRCRRRWPTRSQPRPCVAHATDPRILGLAAPDRAVVHRVPLHLFSDPIEWLQHRGAGAVVLDWRAAAFVLADLAGIACTSDLLAGRVEKALRQPRACRRSLCGRSPCRSLKPRRTTAPPRHGQCRSRRMAAARAADGPDRAHALRCPARGYAPRRGGAGLCRRRRDGRQLGAGGRQPRRPIPGRRAPQPDARPARSASTS